MRRRRGDLRSRAQRTAFWIAVLLGLALGALRVVRVGQTWWHRGIALAESHARFDVAHPGWSFPGRIQTAAVALPAPAALPALDGAQWSRLVDEAFARGYAENCPHPRAGEFCSEPRQLVPRHGDSLEPLVLGWLLGPTAELREHLPLERAPRHLVDAILAAEDRDFYSHHGVNLFAAARAALANLRGHTWRQGASTLTMQLVRAFAGEREKTLSRKFGEAVMAVAVDHHLGKRRVLQAYLDVPFLGRRGGVSVCGFQAAAHHYFAKDAADLDLAEAATLAAILPSPLQLAPDRHPEAARARRDQVLRAMAELYGYDVAAALTQPLVTVAVRELPQRFPAYLAAARYWLEQRLPARTLYDRGLVATAGVDVPAQLRTEALFRARVRALDPALLTGDGPLQSAAVLIDAQSGRLLAAWGGSDSASAFNRAFQARRQPGSAFKPLVYALALSQPPGPDGAPRFTAATAEPNDRRVFHTDQGDWFPRNAAGAYSPTASLAQGLAGSQNVATASLLEQLGGPRALIDLAARVGFDTARFPAELGLALGQAEVSVAEMAQLAATLANGGFRVEATPVVEAVDITGRAYAGPPRRGARVFPASGAALTRELLALAVDSGTGALVRGAAGEPGYLGPVMGKTGTTDAERDAWFVGATPRWASALWLGRDRPQSLGAMASELTAPLWGWWMERLTRGEPGPPPSFPAEPEIIHRRICIETGLLAGPACNGLPAPFLPGTEPRERCNLQHEQRAFETRAVDTEAIWRRARATEATPQVGASP